MSFVIEAFTDGSCLGNGTENSIAGYGIYFPEFTELNKSKKIKSSGGTNIRAELIAIIKCIELVKKKKKKFGYKKSKNTELIIYTDSLFSIKCVKEWMPKWKKNEWTGSNKKPVKNQDLLKKLDHILNKYKFSVTFKHVKGHQKEPDKSNPMYSLWYGNMMSDKLATTATAAATAVATTTVKDK